tara:strand:+ start:12679 stop:12888 length:210 start_codon:yes stop_codon:yes gene_type:complete
MGTLASQIANRKIQDKDAEQHSLDVKEVGFLLRLLDDGTHSGKVLELALQVKLKLQAKLEKLINNKEVM